MTRFLPTAPSSQQISDFIADLASRYDRLSRNRKLDEQTGEEVILPVSENRNVLERLRLNVNELCARYLTLDEEGRDRIRRLVHGQRSLLWGVSGHIGGAAMQVAGPEDVEWVRRGLAAASILGGQEDYRDLLVSLGKLYLAAVQNRIDASRWFKEAGQISGIDAVPFLFNKSTRDFLLGFEQTAYFKSSVANEVERIKRQLPESSK